MAEMKLPAGDLELLDAAAVHSPAALILAGHLRVGKTFRLPRSSSSSVKETLSLTRAKMFSKIHFFLVATVTYAPAGWSSASLHMNQTRTYINNINKTLLKERTKNVHAFAGSARTNYNG